jgi:hypothetical protein
MLSTLALAGCAGGRWFETGRSSATPASDTTVPSDRKAASAAYIRSLCALPRDQRQSEMRSLNEALLPDNVVISCGRSGLDSQ